MQWKSGWRRLARLWQSDTAARVDEELRFHFDQKIAEFEQRGLSKSEAESRAVAEFGDVELVRHSLHEIDQRVVQKNQRAQWWEAIAQDLRYVVRSLRRSPIFTVTVVVTIALGLGANAAIFSVLDRLYVQAPAGVAAPAEVRRLAQKTVSGGQPYNRGGFSYGELRAFRNAAPGALIASYRSEKVRNGLDANAPDIGGTFVEGDYFKVAGVRMALGRPFDSTEYKISTVQNVAIISYQLWQRQYHSDSGVVGKTIDLATHRHVIVGVTADKFRGLDLKPSDVWVPLSTRGNAKTRKPDWYESKNFNGFSVVVRVGSEVDAAMLNARATRALIDPATRVLDDTTATTSLGSIIDGRGGRIYGKEVAISTRLAGVALVILLIACANVVNLLLARAQSRQREIAVRLALGVSRLRLLSQLMIESGVLSLLSGLVALMVAFGGATMLRKLLLPDVQWTEGAVNFRVAVFTAVTALVVGFLVGLVPALQATKPDLANAMKAAAPGRNGRSSRLRASLLITQAALSVVLLVGAGVFVLSLRSVESIDTGFDIRQLTYATVEYDRELGNHEEEIGAGLPIVADRIRKLPGVESVAMAGNIPMHGITFDRLFLPGRDSLPPSGNSTRVLALISPNYYETVGMHVIRGRDFTNRDVRGGELVIAMNENMAKNFWPGEDALTKCVIVGERTSPCRRVVAVVSPAHYSRIIEDPSMMYYIPLAQAAEEWGAGAILIRTTPGSAARVAALAKPEVQQQFGAWARPWMPTMEEMVAPQMRPWRTGAALFTTAGLLALLVAAMGVYSSVAYTLSQRTREMGVRVALGASSGNIMTLVLREGVGIIAIWDRDRRAGIAGAWLHCRIVAVQHLGS